MCDYYLAITLLRRALGVGKVCVRTSVAEAGPLKLSVLALDSENIQCIYATGVRAN